MEITGKVHCLFEQSGTFKNEFKKLGYEAFDYDLQNNFGETDYQIDLFAEIEKGYDNQPSIFDKIGGGDLIMAFFPCIYFSCLSQMGIGWNCHNYINLSTKEKTEAILTRSANRERFFRLLTMMFSIVEQRGLRMIFENPWSMQHFLKSNFIVPPSIVDNDRTLRGDTFKKPTAYWFWGCNPTNGKSYQKKKQVKKIVDCKHDRGGGICSEERSMISPDYARNFICDFILGKEQDNTLLTLF